MKKSDPVKHTDTSINAQTSRIRFLPFDKNRELFKSWYIDYVAELLKNRPEIVFTEQDYVEKYESQNVLKKYFIESGGEKIGFIILQYVNFKSVSRPYWYIVEFYILPQYRRKGIGEKAFRHFLETKHSDFFYYVLKDNEAGRAFWNSVLKKAGLRFAYDPTIHNDDDTDLYVVQL